MLQSKPVLILGLGESGLAMARWLARQGACLRVADSRTNPPNVAALRAAAPTAQLLTGAFSVDLLECIELVAVSPGIALSEAVVQEALARGLPVVSEIELFAQGVRSLPPDSRILAISGSNGKTTTTALTAHLLNHSGIPAIACGNISPSALDALMDFLERREKGEGGRGEPIAADTPLPTTALEEGDARQMAQADPSPFPLPPSPIWVLELSSFQLETTYTLDADAATVLNVSEDHLDRHGSMDAYAAAKARVFQGQGVMVINRDDPRGLAWGEAGRAQGRRVVAFGLDLPRLPGDYGLQRCSIVRGAETLLGLEKLRINGLHNAANAMAALALCEAIDIAPQRLLAALESFTGLAHRVEFVAEIGGVSYFDDSKGTNVGATLAALQGLGSQVAIILGGEGKDQDFSPLAAALAAHGRAVALIGRDAPLIAAAIDGCGVNTCCCTDLEAAVRWCANETRPGDAVLLSPACASFDMFRNYVHRAEAFIDIVHALEREAG